jgi:4-hydroxybutyrate CoA-transferase
MRADGNRSLTFYDKPAAQDDTALVGAIGTICEEFEFYCWWRVRANPNVELAPVDYVNDPFVIGQHDTMISINSALQVDLMGQVNAETIGSRQFSGVGGQVDFVRGTSRSKGGRSIIAMPSTAAGGKLSRICLELDRGAAVTTSRNDVHYIVTEFGIAELRGRSLRQRAEALIAIAHPDFRAGLSNSVFKKAA